MTTPIVLPKTLTEDQRFVLHERGYSDADIAAMQRGDRPGATRKAEVAAFRAVLELQDAIDRLGKADDPDDHSGLTFAPVGTTSPSGAGSRYFDGLEIRTGKQ